MSDDLDDDSSLEEDAIGIMWMSESLRAKVNLLPFLFDVNDRSRHDYDSAHVLRSVDHQSSFLLV